MTIRRCSSPARAPGALAVLALLAGVPGRAAAAPVPLEVASFNVRYDRVVDTFLDENGWTYRCGPRRDRVLAVVGAEAPDLLGVQEALVNQVADLTEALPQYDFYGVGRTDGATQGEYSGIFYRSDRFTRLAEGTFWLSDTPEVPGTVFPCSGSIRIASWVKLHDAASGRDLFVLNTHWDNACQASREQSAALVRAKIDELAGGLPVVLTGDLNASESNVAITTLRGANDPRGPQLTDSYRAVHPVVHPDEATFHDYTGRTAGSRIDYVMHTDELVATEASIVRTGFACGYPSDHYPVGAVLTIEAAPGAVPALARASAGVAALDDPCVPDCPGPGCGAVAAPVVSGSVGGGAPLGAALLVGGLSLAAALRRRRKGGRCAEAASVVRSRTSSTAPSRR